MTTAAYLSPTRRNILLTIIIGCSLAWFPAVTLAHNYHMIDYVKSRSATLNKGQTSFGLSTSERLERRRRTRPLVRGEGGIAFYGKKSPPPPTLVEQLLTGVGEKVQTTLDSGVPVQLSYGFLCGYTAAVALKKIGQAAAVAFGVSFIGLQTLSYYGYITIDHSRLKADIEKVFDADKDGDVDQEDIKIYLKKAMKFFAYGVPSGSGFAVGFYGGLK